MGKYSESPLWRFITLILLGFTPSSTPVVTTGCQLLQLSQDPAFR